MLLRILSRLTPSFVGIFVNKSFTFSVSDLTERKQCGFLARHDSSNGIYISFSFWVSVGVCVCAVHGELSCSVWLGVSGFPEFSVSVIVLGIC